MNSENKDIVLVYTIFTEERGKKKKEVYINI